MPYHLKQPFYTNDSGNKSGDEANCQKLVWPDEKFPVFYDIKHRRGNECGTAGEKNSTIIWRVRPSSMPPTIVAAERETPGTTASD